MLTECFPSDFSPSVNGKEIYLRVTPFLSAANSHFKNTKQN
jgi:hypothetical protein